MLDGISIGTISQVKDHNMMKLNLSLYYGENTWLLKQKNIAYWLQSPEYADIYWEEEVDNPAYAEYLEELKKKEGFVKHVLNYIEKLVGANAPGNDPKNSEGDDSKKRDYH